MTAASSNPDILLIDINAIGYAAMYQPNLAKLSHNGESTAALHGASASVFSLLKLFPGAVPVILWDGHTKWRQELHPGYKANRKDSDGKLAIRESYAKQVTPLRQLFWSLGIPQVICPDSEADDLAGQICQELDTAWQIVMATNDTDWWQALSSNVSWFSLRKKELLTIHDLSTDKAADGPFLSVHEYVTAKSLSGDKSDGIDGIPGIGLKTATKLLRHYGSIEALYEAVDAGSAKKDNTATKIGAPEYRELFQRNLKMIDWRMSPPIPDSAFIISGLPDLPSAYSMLDEFNLKRINTELGTFSISEKNKNSVVSAIEVALSPMRLQPFKKPNCYCLT